MWFNHSRYSLLIYLSYFTLLFWTYTTSYPPYADQLLVYNTSKVIDVLSRFDQRTLYSLHYLNGQHYYAPELRFHDFTYLPFGILPGAIAHTAGFHPRWIFAGIQLLVALPFLFASNLKSHLALSILLVSPLFSLSIPSAFLTNTGFIPLSVLMMLTAAYLAKTHRISTVFLIAASQLMHQLTILFTPFFAILFWKKGHFKLFAIGVTLTSIVLSFFIAEHPAAFYKSAVVYLFSYYGSEVPATSAAAAESNKYILPAVGLFFWIGSILFFSRRKIISAKDTLLVSLASNTLTLILVGGWEVKRFIFATLFLFLLDWPAGEVKRFVRCRQGPIRLTAIAITTTAIFLFFRSRALIAQSLDFPINETREFSFIEKDAQITFDDLLEINPQKTFRFGETSGWLVSQYGWQFWVLTPPGRYYVELCDKKGSCEQEQVSVSEADSFALRIPFYFYRMDSDGKVMGVLLRNGYIESLNGLLYLESVERFSVTRVD